MSFWRSQISVIIKLESNAKMQYVEAIIYIVGLVEEPYSARVRRNDPSQKY